METNNDSHVFLKKYWDEEEITFYLHYLDGYAIEQIEVTPSGVIYLTTERPVVGESILADRSLDDLEYAPHDVISADEFEMVKNTNRLHK